MTGATAWIMMILVLACPPVRQSARPPADTLLVDRAGSLDDVMRAMGAQFEASHPGVVVRGEHGGSVDMARRATDPKTTPDVLGTADFAIIPRVLMPRYATWYAAFARNAIVLAYTDRSKYASEVDSSNWVEVLLRPGVHGGHSDPARDPGGYRAVLALRLTERYYHRPGLAAKLERVFPVAVAPPNQNLLDLLDVGRIDYVLLYRSTARARGLRTLELPEDINLSDPGRAATYGQASIEVAREPGAKDSILIRGEPILYGVTVPKAAAHRKLAEQFVRDLLGEEGKAVLRENGFLVPDRAITGGELPPGLRTSPAPE